MSSVMEVFTSWDSLTQLLVAGATASAVWGGVQHALNARGTRQRAADQATTMFQSDISVQQRCTCGPCIARRRGGIAPGSLVDRVLATPEPPGAWKARLPPPCEHGQPRELRAEEP